MSDLTIDPSLSAPAEAGVVATVASWQEQDILLREMWTQNKSSEAISEALGRSIPAIMTRAARLGLPRRAAPGRKPGQRSFSHQGQSAPTARRAAPRPSTSYANAPMQTSPRICLMCLKKFESMGRHNRICPTCKGSAEYESASSLPNIHMPGS